MHPRQRGISSTPIVSEQMAHRLRGSERHVNNIAMTPSPPTITTRRAIHDLWRISTDFLKCIRSSSKSKYLIIFIVAVVVLLHFISAASVVFSSPSEKGTVVAVQKESVDLSPHRAGGDNGDVGRGGERQGGQLHSKELELSYNQKTKDVESLLRSVARVKDLRKTLDKLIAGRQERSTLVSHLGSNKLIPVTVDIKAHVADDGVDRYTSQTMQDDNTMTANDKENDQTAVKVSNGRGIHTEKKLLASTRRSGEETSNEVRRGQETHVTSNNVIAPPPPPPLKLTASPKPLPTTSSDRAEGLAVASMRKCEHFDYHRSSLGGDERRGGPAGVGAGGTLKKRKKTIMATEEESVRIRRELMKASFHRHISSFEEANGQKSSLLKAERTSRREYDLSKVYWRPVLSDTEHSEDLGIRAADHLKKKGIIKSPLPDALRCSQQMLPQHSILPLERALLECTRKGDEYPFVFPPQPHDPSQPHPHVASLFSPSDAMQRFHCLLSVINKKRLYGTKYFDSYSSHTNPIRNLDGGGGDAGGRGGQGGDRPSGASTCADVYGLDLITRLKRAKTTVCEQPEDRVDGKGLATTRGSWLSYIGCNAVIAHPSHDVHTAVCSASNVSISFSRRRSMLDGDYPWLSFQHGALKAHCRNLRNEGDGGWGRRRGRDDDVHNKLPKPRTMRGHEYFPATELKFMHCLADWMDLGYSAMESGPNAELACASLKAKPTYFLTRSGDFSPFAATHDYLNTLIAFLVEHEALEKKQKPVGLDNDNEKGLDGARHLSPQAVGGGAQIVVMDRMGMGFYAPILQLLFSRADTTVQWLPDLRDDPLHDSACYEKAIFNIPARLSPIYNHDSCGGSILMRLYADLILYVTGAYRVRSPDHTLVMTVIARRDYSATGHTIGRRIGNHEAFVSALREQLDPKPLAAIAGRSSSSSPPADESINIVVNNIDYADFDFDQQVAISRSTDVLVAMHGAGLVQMMFMGGSRGDDLFVFGDSYNNAGVESLSAKSISAPYEPKGMGAGGVFELFCPEKPSSNFRYSQLAMRMGLLYGSYEIGGDDNVVPLHTVVPQIQKLAEDVWRRKVQ